MSKRASRWVLRDGKRYFREWGGIGPRTTDRLEEAMRFESRQKAMQHEAYSFALTSFEPEPVDG